jgi:hypothetical protein
MKRKARMAAAIAAPLLALGLAASPAQAQASTPAADKLPGCGPAFQLDQTNFAAKPRVTNRFFPLVPGTRWVLRGSVAGSEHRVVTTVTDLTKVIDGVKTVVLLDEDFDGDALQEAELAFFAQDRDGTVWALGEYPEEYDADGSFAGAPSVWIVGLQHATTGIAMRAHPKVGTVSYSQGRAPKVDFNDCGVVFANGLSTTVPADSYQGVLETDEWAPLDPAGGHQRKFYAPGVGLVRVEPVGGDNPEILVLDSVERLSAAELRTARAHALELDAHGRVVSPRVYGKTPPAE